MRRKEEEVTSKTYVVGRKESISELLASRTFARFKLRCVWPDSTRHEWISEHAIEIKLTSLEEDLRYVVDKMSPSFPNLLIVTGCVNPAGTKVGSIAWFRGERTTSVNLVPRLFPLDDGLCLGSYYAMKSQMEAEAIDDQMRICIESVKSKGLELEQHIHYFAAFLEVS